jgi:hypothetical protein
VKYFGKWFKKAYGTQIGKIKFNKMSENENIKVDCFLVGFECDLYFLPQDLADQFYITHEDDRSRVFEKYMIKSGDFTLGSVLIDQADMQSILDGDFG